MLLLKYFDLGLLPPELTLGPSDKKARARRARQRLWLTLAMYLGVVLGVLAENLLSLVKTNVPLTWTTFNGLRVLTAAIIAIAIFPHVFPKVFGHMSAPESTAYRSASRHVLQFCIAFQNGFFWQALLSQLMLNV